MNTSTARRILLALGACAALGAQAAMPADTGRITNGGTGFIGVTESYGQPATVAVGSRTGMPAGEASTWVNGRPNQNPEAPGMASGGTQGQSMGNTGAMGPQGVRGNARNPSWGTPD